MHRILFGILAGASLVCCLAVCGIWARTYSQPWMATWNRPDDGLRSRWVTFRVGRGEIEIMFCHMDHRADPKVRDTSWTIGWYGLSWMRYYQWYGGHDKLHFADSQLACVFALLPAAWVVMTMRRRRHLQRLTGHCRKCGYDLRASAGRCPECGVPVPSSDFDAVRRDAMGQPDASSGDE